MTFLQKIKRYLKKLAQVVEKENFDPSTLNDDVAMKTEWTPLSQEGANFCTHSLRKTSSHRVEFKALYTALAFPGIFMAVGLGVIVLTISPEAPEDKFGILFLAIFGTLFFLGGLLFFFVMKKTSVFDKSAGFYWKGQLNLVFGPQIATSKKQCKLDLIYALQLLRKEHTDSDENYFSYELNLILKDGQRLNVVDHGKISQLRADTEILGEFLGVPVWDITPEPATMVD